MPYSFQINQSAEHFIIYKGIEKKETEILTTQRYTSSNLHMCTQKTRRRRNAHFTQQTKLSRTR